MYHLRQETSCREVVVQENMSDMLIAVYDTQNKDSARSAEHCRDHIYTWQPFWMLRHIISICYCCNA